MIFRTVEVVMARDDLGWPSSNQDIDVHGEITTSFKDHGLISGEKIIEFDTNKKNSWLISISQ